MYLLIVAIHLVLVVKLVSLKWLLYGTEKFRRLKWLHVFVLVCVLMAACMCVYGCVYVCVWLCLCACMCMCMRMANISARYWPICMWMQHIFQFDLCIDYTIMEPVCVSAPFAIFFQ